MQAVSGKNVKQCPKCPASFVALLMNEQDERDFWIEYLAVTIRYEERRTAALRADLQALKREQKSGLETANLDETNQTTFSTSRP
jgi:hypothetical protein